MLAGILACLQVFSAVPAAALGNSDVSGSSVIKQLINENSMSLAPGVTEKKLTYVANYLDYRTEAYCIDVAAGSQTSISLGTPDDGEQYKMQTVRDQANAARRNGKNVIAAVNGDYYNMATGEPQGVEVKNGKEIHANQAKESFFGIANDGKPVIGDAETYQSMKGQLKEAIGGPRILVQNGKSTNQDDIIYPCAAVGIRSDSSVFFLVVDGLRFPRTAGITLKDLTQLLIENGAQTALMLDGGGSATCMARSPGDNSLSCQNTPSDGNERTVGNSILISSSAASDGKFASAFLSPQDKTYTPKSTVQMQACGLDSSDAPASLPGSGLSWSLSDSSYGTIDENGFLTSNGKTGQVAVRLNYQGKVVGTATVEFAVPDEISFDQADIGLSLKQGAMQDPGFRALYQGRSVVLKPGDIQWNTTGGIGTVDSSGILHAVNGVATGTIVAQLSGTDLKASMTVSVGLLPQKLYTFEDEDGGLSGWSASTANRGETTSISLTDAKNDPHSVRFGQHALKLSFDLTNAQKGTTLGAYAGPANSVDISGAPTAIGMWVYATPGAQGYWMRMYLYDAAGKFHPINFTDEGIGINWTGWKYVEAPIPSDYKGPFKTFPCEMVRLMSVKSGITGPMTKGYIYIDDISAVYGSNNVDTVAPTVDKTGTYTAGKDTNFTDGTVYSSNNISIVSYLHDDNTDGKSSGIDWEKSSLYVDGKNYCSDKMHFSYDKDGILNLRGLKWADGVHKITADVYDKFGNETTKDSYFVVNTGDGARFNITSDKTAQLGNPYQIHLTADNAADVTGVTAKIKVGKDFPVNTNNVTFDSSVSGESEYDSDTGILTLTINAASGLAATGTKNLATISVDVPPATKSSSKLEYDIESATITCSTDKGSDYAPTFSEKPSSIQISAAYNLAVQNAIVGQTGSVLVTDQDGKPVEGASVTMTQNGTDSVNLGTTDEKGLITSSKLTDSVKKYTLQASKESKYSFAVSAQSYTSKKTSAPDNILSGSTADPTTQKTVTWMTSPIEGGTSTVMKYALSAEYGKSGETAFRRAEGSSKILYYDVDSAAVRENSATVTNLQPGTEYSYRVGDGTNWSSVQTFTTAAKGTSKFTFDVFGDTQSTMDKGLDDLSNIFTKIEQSDTKPLFTLHVGDFVDDEQIFSQIDATAAMFQKHSVFDSIDMIHVLGNHEYMGDNGTKGSFIYGVPQNGPDVDKQGCYSMNYGNMHISVIGWTDNAVTLQSELDWLRHDVRSNNKTWNIVATHQPPFNKNPDDPSTLFNQMLPPVCDELGIDFVFSGHDHSYGRTYPLFAGKQAKDGGTVYICAGHTAEKTYDVNPADPDAYAYFQTDENKDDKTYITCSVDGNTMTLKAQKPDGSVIDTYTSAAKVRADKTSLESELNQAATYSQNYYTDVSWKALQSAKDAAQKPYEALNASQADVDAAVSSLKAAIVGLKLTSAGTVNQAVDGLIKDPTETNIATVVSTVQKSLSNIIAAPDGSALDTLEKASKALSQLDDVLSSQNSITKNISVPTSTASGPDKMTAPPTIPGLLVAAGITADESNKGSVVTLKTTQKETPEVLSFDLNLSKGLQPIHALQIPVAVTFQFPASFQNTSSTGYQVIHTLNNGQKKPLELTVAKDQNGSYTGTFVTDSFSNFTVEEKPKVDGGGSTGSSGGSTGGSTGGSGNGTTPTASVTFVSDTNSALFVNNAYTFKITSKDGKVPTFVVGTAGVFDTQLVKHVGDDYYFKITAIGKPGASAGIYVNGTTRLLVATVKSSAPTVKSDTTSPFSVKAGKSYVFKLTADAKPTFVAGTGAAFRVNFVKNSGNDYFFRVTAVGKAGSSSGFYINSAKTPVAKATISK